MNLPLKGRKLKTKLLPSLGVGAAAFAYVALDYWRERATWLPPALSATMQPALWAFLALLCILRAPRYPYWALEIKAAPKFLACVFLMLLALFFEIVMVQFATVVLGMDWHRAHEPLPDPGQWILLALNDHLPASVRSVLRMRLIELHHFIMLFIMLGFSVLFGSVRPPGLALGARYCFTMAVARTLRWITFCSTILPAVRPWCAQSRFADSTPAYPHPWAAKYHMPYATNQPLLYQLLKYDSLAAPPASPPTEHVPEWGFFQFLVPFLRPIEPEGGSVGGSKGGFTIRPGGGCNDLAYSGHVVLAVLTACAWQEAKPGWESAAVWFLVLHSAQREIRERQHYTLDVVSALYVGWLLWRTTGWLWARAGDPAAASRSADERTALLLAPMVKELVKAAKDGDMERVTRSLLAAANAAADPIGAPWDALPGEVEAGDIVELSKAHGNLWLVGVGLILMVVGLCLIAFWLTVGG